MFGQATSTRSARPGTYNNPSSQSLQSTPQPLSTFVPPPPKTPTYSTLPTLHSHPHTHTPGLSLGSSPPSPPSPLVATPSRSYQSGPPPFLSSIRERHSDDPYPRTRFAAPPPPPSFNPESDLGSPIKMHHSPTATPAYGIAGGLIVDSLTPSPNEPQQHDVFTGGGGQQTTHSHPHLHQLAPHPHAPANASHNHHHHLAPLSLKPAAARPALRSALSHNAILDNGNLATPTPNSNTTLSPPTYTSSNPSSWPRRVMAPVLNAQTVDSNGATQTQAQFDITSPPPTTTSITNGIHGEKARLNTSSSGPITSLPPVTIARTTRATVDKPRSNTAPIPIPSSNYSELPSQIPTETPSYHPYSEDSYPVTHPPPPHPLHSSFDSAYPAPLHPSWVNGYSAPAFDPHHPYYAYRFMPGMHQALLKPVEPILAPGEMPAPRPTQSYAALIGEALLLSSPPHQLYVSEISDSIKKRYAYYRQNPSKIYNGVRHQTSMCKAFVKLPRPFGDQSGGARKWAIREGCETWFNNGGFHPPPNHSTPTTSSPTGHKRGGGGSGGSGASGASGNSSGGKAKATARAKQLAIGTGPVSPSIKRQAIKSDDSDEWPGSGGPSTGRAWDPYRHPHPYNLPPLPAAPTTTSTTAPSAPSTTSLAPAFPSTQPASTQSTTQPYFSGGYHYPAFAPLPAPPHQQPVMSWGYPYPSSTNVPTQHQSYEVGWRAGSTPHFTPSNVTSGPSATSYDVRPRTLSSDGSHLTPESYAARPPPPSGQDMHRYQAQHHGEYGHRDSASPLSHGAQISSHGTSPIDV